jgi:hypothetical protein
MFAIGALAVGRRLGWRSAGACIVPYAIAAGVEWWAIAQSRSSTAGIGFLFLPLFAAMVGFLSIGFVVTRRSNARSARWAGVIMGAAAALLIAQGLFDGLRTIERNRARDAANVANEDRTRTMRHELAAMLSNNKGSEEVALAREIRARNADRSFVLVALESPFVPTAIVDSLADSADAGIALEAVRSPAVSSATLERVFRTRADIGYFAQAIAANPRSPSSVLRELFHRPGVRPQLDIWLAANPATPNDVVAAIAASTTDSNVRRKLGARRP